MPSSPAVAHVLAGVGPRLKRLRTERGMSLSALCEATGISTSTLSRLETGQRRPNLELLLPIAAVHGVPLDEIISAPAVEEKRARPRRRRADGKTVFPLTRNPGPLQSFKLVLPATRSEPDPCTHEGHEWLYVLSGRLRLVLAGHDMVLEPGEAAEFDTRTPHWFGCAGDGPVELLSLFGRQGERVHVRARTRSRAAAGEIPRGYGQTS